MGLIAGNKSSCYGELLQVIMSMGDPSKTKPDLLCVSYGDQRT